jgi:thiaminase
MDDLSFTKCLLKSQPDAFRAATQSPFLRAGAEGTLDKETLGRWLGNDRLYIHAYIRGIGKVLSLLELPGTVESQDQPPSREERMLDWAVDALVNIRREKSFFIDTAAKYGIDLNLPGDERGKVFADAKIEGLRRFETLFDSIGTGPAISPPWIDAAVIFWGTEKCYLTAWNWAKAHIDPSKSGSDDADGGALRNEFIDNWTSPEFEKFVDELGRLIDDVVAEQIKISGVKVVQDLVRYFTDRWLELLQAEEKFWPELK